MQEKKKKKGFILFPDYGQKCLSWVALIKTISFSNPGASFLSFYYNRKEDSALH